MSSQVYTVDTFEFWGMLLMGYVSFWFVVSIFCLIFCALIMIINNPNSKVKKIN